MAKHFQQPPVMNTQQHFAQAPMADIERSTFDRSHGYKTTFDAGKLIPTYLDEVLPGDTFKMRATGFARLATPLKPFMDNLYMDTHFFFVPNRLVWDNFQRFMGEQDDIDDNPDDYTVPKTLISMNRTGDDTNLATYFGIPSGMNASNANVNALPFRGYMLIFNEWYRDENLQNKGVVPKGDGPDTWTSQAVLSRNKRKDYFTSALPWPQKGDAVNLPLGTTAPIISDGQVMQVSTTYGGGPRNLTFAVQQGGTANQVAYSGTNATASMFFADQGLMADLTAATTVTINDLRTSFQIQKLLERNARGGTRYIELVLSHFGVSSPDLRATRPVYLGGGSSTIQVNPVAATANIDAETIQGDLAAYGTTINKSGFEYSFTEHGYVFGITSVRCDQTYQHGIERHWMRTTRWDYYYPATAHLGEQSIRNWEIYWEGDSTDTEVFGYQERHAEYRYKPSRITGKFRSTNAQSLDYWHLATDFGSTPALNALFVIENPPIDRVIAVPSEPHFLLDMWFDLKCTRPMPVFAVPGLVDHF